MFIGQLEWKLGPGRIFGLDISLRNMAVTVLHPDRQVEQYEVELDEPGLRDFLARLRQEDRVALEATSNAWYLYSRMNPLVQEVAVADAKKLKLIAHSHAKTDRNDSRILAILLALGFLPTVWMPDPETQGDRELLHCRTALLGKQTRTKNQIRATLGRHGVTFERSDVTAQDMQLYALRLGTRLPATAQQAMASLLRELAFLEGELRNVDALVRIRTQRWQPEIEQLLTVPGIGVLIAYTVLAVIGDIKRFPTAPSLGNYTGACPIVRASAGKSWSGGITKAGPTMLRWALTEAVLGLTRSNGRFRNMYRRIKRGRKNRHGIAVMACVRELAEVIWEMLTHGHSFQECVQQPVKPESAQRKRQREQRSLQEALGVVEGLEQPSSTLYDNVDLLMALSGRREQNISSRRGQTGV